MFNTEILSHSMKSSSPKLLNGILGHDHIQKISDNFHQSDITKKTLTPLDTWFRPISKTSPYVLHFIFQLLDECQCWWTKESPRAHVAKFYGRLRLICSVLRASKFAVLKLIEIVILWIYYTIPFGFSFFRHFWDIIFQPFQLPYFLWLRITDEGSIP